MFASRARKRVPGWRRLARGGSSEIRKALAARQRPGTSPSTRGMRRLESTYVLRAMGTRAGAGTGSLASRAGRNGISRPGKGSDTNAVTSVCPARTRSAAVAEIFGCQGTIGRHRRRGFPIAAEHTPQRAFAGRDCKSLTARRIEFSLCCQPPSGFLRNPQWRG
jgi:hypothetical protein